MCYFLIQLDYNSTGCGNSTSSNSVPQLLVLVVQYASLSLRWRTTLIRQMGATVTVLALFFIFPLIAVAANILQTQSTKTYNITLVIGPSEAMLMPDAAKSATSGE